MKPRDLPLPAYFLACLILGGASGGGYEANLVLQLIALVLVVWSVWTWPRRSLLRQEKIFLTLVLLASMVVILQIIPIPYALWDRLPMRHAIGNAARTAGYSPAPTFLTLMPHETLKSAVWLLPALGLAVGLLRFRSYRPDYLAWSLLGVMALSVLLGALQLAGGRNSPWYFYAFTNRGSTVGIFANSNHLVTLLLVSVPFLAALLKKAKPRDVYARAGVWAWGIAFLAIILAGIYMNGSLAGYGLFLPVLAASALILTRKRRVRRLSAALLVSVVIVGIVLVFVTEEGARLLDQTGTLSPGAREVIFANTWKAMTDFMPVGSGIGSFADVYRLYEDPSAIRRSYINHAHNDYLEILLETGILGGLVLVIFLGWWARQAVRIWSAIRTDHFALAAVIASATILVHSIVDYPMRTAAISAVFAWCCILMLDWVEWRALGFRSSHSTTDAEFSGDQSTAGADS